MKLSEVIKAIEDGSESEFVLNEVSIKFVDGVIKFNMFNRSGYFETNANWEEVKPPRQWSEKELLTFKMFPWAKWFARERNGDILLSETKPEHVYDEDEFFSYWCIDEEEPRFVTISTTEENELTTITFEESPIYIGDLKGE